MDREQLVIGAVFSFMGLGTMLCPHQLIPLSFKSFDSPLDSNLVLTFRCFGAQASLVGLLLLSSKFTKTTYRNFGLAMLPFFAFDYWAWQTNTITDLGALGDLLGNIIFTTFSWMGYQRLCKE